ncbi:MAG: ABC transporter substrate-binding protein [Lachnospiraceae bacterium]|jgi:peptide/nickel transport system substrate-binding protein|nr:ABC transporter substrate-binding protein [Lachnospiraceae bacterium]
MKRKVPLRFFSVMVICSLTIAPGGCLGDKQGDEVLSSVITVGIPQDIEDSLDPHRAVAAGTEEVLFNIFEGLVKPTSDGNLIPAIASEFHLAENGLVYTFTLREGVKFHDGSIVTVMDVVYSLKRCAAGEHGVPLVAAFVNLRDVFSLDEHTIEVHLHEPDNDFLAALTVAIIPAANDSPARNPIGTGPYAYVSRSPQENIILERFDDYWGEAAHIEKVVFKIIANTDMIVMELEGGSIDMFARLTSSQAAELSSQFDILEGTMNLVQGLFLNNAVPPFDNELVRQALSYATDVEMIMLMVSDGKGTPIGSSMFPAFGKYFLEELAEVYSYDLEKAKELLASAGFADGFSFTITVPANYLQHVDTAQILVEQYRALGVSVRIELVEWDSWLSDVFAGRNFEATIIGLTASTLTARAILDFFYSESGRNFTNYHNHDFDMMFLRALASTDDEARTEYFKECQRILTATAASVFIQDLPEFVALRKNFRGYEFYPLYVQDLSRIYLVDER